MKTEKELREKGDKTYYKFIDKDAPPSRYEQVCFTEGYVAGYKVGIKEKKIGKGVK